jgi:hypothetical protein
VLPALIVGLILLVASSSVFDIIFDAFQGAKQERQQSEIVQVRLAQSALSDSEYGLQSYVTSGRLEGLQRYLSGIELLTQGLSPLLPQLDRNASDRLGTNGTPTLVSRDFEGWLAGSKMVVGRYQRNEHVQDETAPLHVQVEELFERLQRNIGSYLNELTAQAALNDDLSNTEQHLLSVFNLGCAIFAAVSIIYAFRNILRALGLGFTARQQVEQLFFSNCSPRW